MSATLHKHKTPKTPETLDRAAEVSVDLHDVTARRRALRDQFLQAIYMASKDGHSQKQIADWTGFSRQRISQFLAEYQREQV